MKKLWTLATALVLTAALFTGCGCTNSNKGTDTTPTGMTESMPTILPTQAPTVPTTQATQPTTEATTPTGSGTMDDASTGSTGESSATEETLEGRARRTVPDSNHGTGSNSGSGMGTGTSGR